MDNDTISRQAALDGLHLLAIEALRKQRYDYNALITICSNKLKDLPAVQPEQKTGRWEIIGEEVGALNIKYPIKKCSECGWTHSLFIPENACPNCGAKMENGGNLFD